MTVWWRERGTHTTRRADNEDAALKAMQEEENTYGDDALTVVGVEDEGGDCWLKVSVEPKPTDGIFRRVIAEADVEFDDLIIRPPGTHPGGRSWWIDLPGRLLNPMYDAT